MYPGLAVRTFSRLFAAVDVGPQRDSGFRTVSSKATGHFQRKPWLPGAGSLQAVSFCCGDVVWCIWQQLTGRCLPGRRYSLWGAYRRPSCLKQKLQTNQTHRSEKHTALRYTVAVIRNTSQFQTLPVVVL